jgi:phosphopantothenoylcysteine synthetase/decarboxylase
MPKKRKLKVVVTSGPGVEHIDDVRILTNISTGKLGSTIAEKFALAGHDVVYVSSSMAAQPKSKKIKKYSVTGVESLVGVMVGLVKTADVVVHAMAVADYGFKRNGTIKLKSNNKDGFIEYLKNNIRDNPKVIALIKKWNPNCCLIGFKLESGQTHESLIDIAFASLVKNSCDMVVANDTHEMEEKKDHVAYLVLPDKQVYRAVGKQNIAKELVNYVSKKYSKSSQD